MSSNALDNARFNELWNLMPPGTPIIWVNANNRAVRATVSDMFFDGAGAIRVRVEWGNPEDPTCASPTADRVGIVSSDF